MVFDSTISLGNILAVVTIVITVLGLHNANIKRISEMEVKLSLVFDWFKDKIKEDRETAKNNRREDRREDSNH